MKKIICLAIVCILVFSLLCGCSTVSVDTPDTDNSQLTVDEVKKATKGEIVAKVVLSSDLSIYYYRDTLTDVMYMISDDFRAGGLSVMYHSDGTPLLYSEWLEMVVAKVN